MQILKILIFEMLSLSTKNEMYLLFMHCFVGLFIPPILNSFFFFLQDVTAT